MAASPSFRLSLGPRSRLRHLCAVLGHPTHARGPPQFCPCAGSQAGDDRGRFLMAYGRKPPKHARNGTFAAPCGAWISMTRKVRHPHLKSECPTARLKGTKTQPLASSIARPRPCVWFRGVRSSCVPGRAVPGHQIRPGSECYWPSTSIIDYRPSMRPTRLYVWYSVRWGTVALMSSPR